VVMRFSFPISSDYTASSKIILNFQMDVEARKSWVAIPSEARMALLPPNELPIRGLINFESLPSLSHHSNHLPSIDDVFSRDQPVSDSQAIDLLSYFPVPPRNFLINIVQKRDEKWELGYRSIIGITGLTRLPFWVASVLMLVEFVVQSRNKWITAWDWVDCNILAMAGELDARFVHLAHGLQKMFDVVGWNSHLTPGIRASDLTQLFSDSVLDQNLIDGITKVISTRLLALPNAGKKAVVTTDFQYALEVADTVWEAYQTHESLRYLRELEAKIQAGEIRQLATPINLCNAHWAVIEIDFDVRLICSRDSLQWAIPNRLCRRIHEWLTMIGFRLSFTEIQVDTPQQNDAVSCGVCSWNSLEQFAYYEHPWSPEAKHCLRARYGILACLSSGRFSPEDLNIPNNSPVSRFHSPNGTHFGLINLQLLWTTMNSGDITTHENSIFEAPGLAHFESDALTQHTSPQLIAPLDFEYSQVMSNGDDSEFLGSSRSDDCSQESPAQINTKSAKAKVF
jgi:hypothetical protein